MTHQAPARIALACQGGGAQTAFTAGVLHYLLYRLGVEETLPQPPYAEAEEIDPAVRAAPHGDAKGKLEVVALSGTSGGAMCATLAWDELITGRRGKLERFWLTGYPDGNAAARYREAWANDLKAFREEGHLPWLRVLDRFRNEFGLWLLEEPPWMDLVPFHVSIEAKPYYFFQLFERLDIWVPPLARSLLDAWRNAAREAAEPFGGPQGPLATLVKDLFDLNPLYADSAIRRECDSLNLLRELLRTTLAPAGAATADFAAIRAAFHSDPHKAHLPELLIGAVDVQQTHRYRGDTDPEMEKTGPPRLQQGAEPQSSTPDSQALAVLKERLEALEKRLEPNERHRADRTNFKSFRGSEHLGSPDDLIDCLLASAAIPVLMRGPIVDGTVHWDGLFSTNPPIHDLPDVHGGRSDRNPQQIWVIRINPMEQANVPDTPSEIEDRRNELAGNLSLVQEIRAVRNMNGATKDGRFYPPIAFGFIDMAERFAAPLDYSTKLDRRIEPLWRLYKHGIERGHDFYERWASA